MKDVVRRGGFEDTEMYCLRDTVKAKYRRPYQPERDEDEQSLRNAIRLHVDGEARPIEISMFLPRLRPLAAPITDRSKYYVPKQVRTEVAALVRDWKNRRAASTGSSS